MLHGVLIRFYMGQHVAPATCVHQTKPVHRLALNRLLRELRSSVILNSMPFAFCFVFALNCVYVIAILVGQRFCAREASNWNH